MIVTNCCIVHPAFRGDSLHRAARLLGLCPAAAATDNRCMTRVLLALLVALTGTACAPDLNWREWRAADAGLSVLFPCKPVRQQRNVRLAGKPVQLTLHVCDAGQVSWSVSHAEAEDPSAVGPMLQELIGAAHANLGTAVAGISPHVVAGATPRAPSGRFSVKGQAPDGRALEGAFLVFSRGAVVVQVTALGPRLSAESVETFMASVRAGS